MQSQRFDVVVRRTAINPELVDISSRTQNDYSLSREMMSLSTLFKFLFPRSKK
ncbi:MAG: hypothetical protein Q7R47_04060 [Candidatus Diapherotrites archaeon]|nr:hypothetical protein [Candidatus Diapherotrites archaeon]